MNLKSDTDFESSGGVWITSESEQEALEWGRVIAECFVNWLCEQDGKPSYSWIEGNFSYWIVKDPTSISYANDLPIVLVGEMPDFSLLRDPD